MTDSEERLRRFRPASPPGDLRNRILALENRRPDSLLEWAPAAAAFLLAAIFSLLAANMHASVERQQLESSGQHERMNELIEALGGDGFAKVEAARLVALDEEP